MSARPRRRIDTQRPERVLEGVLETIAAHGIEGLTHRRVAEAAGVPLAATTYYFATLEEMLEAALRVAIERDLAAVRQGFADATPSEVPDLLVGYVNDALADDRERVTVIAELYIAALRRPSLRDLVVQWEETWAELLAPTFGPAASTVSVTIGGTIIRELVFGDSEGGAGLALVLKSLARQPAN